MGSFGSLWGHPTLRTVSEVKSYLRFQISDPNYLLIHVHIVYGMGPFGSSLWGHYSLQTASEVKSDLRFEISDLNYLCFNVYLGSNW